jgi:hypothetical protein
VARSKRKDEKKAVMGANIAATNPSKVIGAITGATRIFAGTLTNEI